ncbi:hypothetical protein GCM10009827_085770 [Dactylosporangium maewongense]|uniref:Uncharacterized protein n=1 Tax=Dactylosporangium maewongense TaxID=634393 RepID=A0ABP4MYF3_9ACTN
MTWKNQHAAIEIRYGPFKMKTERLGGIGDDVTEPVFSDSYMNGGRTYEVDVPNAEAAMRRQFWSTLETHGPYHLERNSCATYCGDILRAGGLDVPGTSFALGQWLVKNARRLS